MAAVSLSGNTVYVTAQGDFYTAPNNGNVRVLRIIITPSAHGSGSPSITFTDYAQSPSVKIKLCTANTTSTPFPFEDSPLVFTGGFSVSSLSGAVATIIVQGG
jgi:hypothetical protein